MNKKTKKEIREYLQERDILMPRSKYKYYFSNWSSLSTFTHLPDDFIAKYKKRVDWKIISRCQKKMSEEFIFEHRNRLHMKILFMNGTITEKRFEEIEFLLRKEIPRFELMEVEE